MQWSKRRKVSRLAFGRELARADAKGAIKLRSLPDFLLSFAAQYRIQMSRPWLLGLFLIDGFRCYCALVVLGRGPCKHILKQHIFWSWWILTAGVNNHNMRKILTSLSQNPYTYRCDFRKRRVACWYCKERMFAAWEFSLLREGMKRNCEGLLTRELVRGSEVKGKKILLCS